MMDKRTMIYIGGAVGALLILRSRKPTAAGASKSPLSKLLSKVVPTVPRPTTTNLATGYGTRTVPVGPSSGLGFNPGTPAGTTRAGINANTTLPSVALITQSLAGIVSKLLPTAAPAAAAKPATGSPGGISAGGGSGGGGENYGSQRSPTSASSRSSTSTDGGQNGFYDDQGNWVQTDADGNIIDGSGYYDTSGNYVRYQAYGPSDAQLGVGLPDVTPQNADLIAAATQSDSADALESVPLDASQTVPFDTTYLPGGDNTDYSSAPVDQSVLDSSALPIDSSSPDYSTAYDVSIPDLSGQDFSSYDTSGGAAPDYYAGEDAPA